MLCLSNHAYVTISQAHAYLSLAPSSQTRHMHLEHNRTAPSSVITHATSLFRPSFTAVNWCSTSTRNPEPLIKRPQAPQRSSISFHRLPQQLSLASTLVSSASLHHAHHQPEVYRDGRPHLRRRRRWLSRRARSGPALIRLAPPERGDRSAVARGCGLCQSDVSTHRRLFGPRLPNAY